MATQSRFVLIWGLLFFGSWMAAWNFRDLLDRPIDGAAVLLLLMLLPGVATTWILWHLMRLAIRFKK
jgi:hypothetical protein